jgi:hypothetical protein
VTKLTERALVKDLLQIPRADSRQDTILDSLIQTVSAECERICRRNFSHQPFIVEYFTSYDQSFSDPEPQLLIVGSFPIDGSFEPQVQWSPYDHREDLFIKLEHSTGDYSYDLESGLISIRYMGVAATNLPIVGGTLFTYHPRGFQVSYAGGYPTNDAPSPDDNPDPLDDYGITQVPTGLKLTVAKKVAADYRALRPVSDYFSRRGVLNQASVALDVFRQDLKPYMKRNVMFA